jgi:hypothetical protein
VNTGRQAGRQSGMLLLEDPVELDEMFIQNYPPIFGSTENI